MSCKLAIKTLILLLLAIEISIQLLSQTTSLSFTSIPLTNADLNAPGRGVEQWHDQNIVNVPTEGVNTQRLDVYYRFVWTKIEGPTLGSYTWTFFDSLVNMAIQKKQKFSFGIMTVYPGGTLQNGLVSYDGGNSSYPLYLHTLMQSEAVKDWRTGSTWTPNYNSTNYQNRLLALHQAIDAHIKSTSYNGVPYKSVISCIDIRGYGAWGEWHSGYTPNNVISDYPAGTFPTVASLKKIVDAHTQGFPDFPLVAMIAAFDAQWLQNTWNPPEIAYYVLTQRNNWGLIGWRRDQWGATDSYLSSYLENNTRSFNGLVFRDSIMVRWKSSPITGEPPAWNPNNYADLERQIRLYHATSFGNGNYGVTPTTTIKDRVRASSKACGYRLILESGNLTLNGNNLSISLNWKNTGLAPTYENWNVVFELKNGSNVTVWSGTSQFKPKGFQPLGSATLVTDNFNAVPAGTFNLYLSVKDSNGYRDPLPLAINGRNADGSYTLTTQLTVQTSTPSPTVSVTNNCGNSLLTASGYTGTLLWSTGETTPSITVNNGGTYTVTQTVDGSTSAPASATAAPKTIPAIPVITVTNNCGNSLLSTNTIAGTTLLWSNGSSSSSITVTNQASYNVTRTETASGCTSTASASSDPKTLPATPVFTVTNNCGNSVLTADDIPGTTLAWSTGATSSSITVTNAASYNVTRTDIASGCTSTANALSAPKTIPATPAITVTNNCGNSVLSTSTVAGTTLLWSNGATTSSITVTNQATYDVTRTDIANSCTSTASAISIPKAFPEAPAVSVVNNCGYSVLTAIGQNLSWNTGATSSSITVTTAGTYSVTETVNGCTSSSASVDANPEITPLPIVSVVNECGYSVLSATGTNLLWSNGETNASITVSTGGSYSVRQTLNNCPSALAVITATPKTIPSTPTISVTNNCGNSVLSTSVIAGTSLLWTTGQTSSSITVTDNSSYSVTRTDNANNCTATASAISIPKAFPAAPSVSAVNNCGNSVLTATGQNLLWNTGSTNFSITVTAAGAYTVSQTVNGCPSPLASIDAEPEITPLPIVSVVNECGYSVLSATGTNLLWSSGETDPSITVSTGGSYNVRQTLNNCPSAWAAITATPKTIPSIPTISVTNNCGSSVLSTSVVAGTSLLWSSGQTSSSITVNDNASYGVTRTDNVNHCTSTASAISAPKAFPAAPAVSAVNNCGNSVLTAIGQNLLWNTGSTNSSITVTTAGTYTVSQTVNGCLSPLASIDADPEITPLPVVSVVNECGYSVLSATGTNLLWSDGWTDPSITVNTGGSYSVRQTLNNCPSAWAAVTAIPKTIPSAPVVTVVNNCGNSVLSTTGQNLLWNTGTTGPSISVTTPGTYTVKQTVGGCTSTDGTGDANPKAIPLAPDVTVTNNCGNSLLTAIGNNLLWSTGETNSSITVNTSGSYTVRQTENGCQSPLATGIASPKVIPSPPSVTVTNGCNSSLLTAVGSTGNFLWNTGETTESITVTTAGTYNVQQRDLVTGCTSTTTNGTANPKTIPAPPTVTVTNNCGNSVLTATGTNLHWSTGATTASITVTTAGTYTVTQTVNGCESAAASKDAAPWNSQVDPPTVEVVNNCGNSELTATGNNLVWNTGATSASITVTTAGTYTVTQKIGECTSPAASVQADPQTTPLPIITVVNNCGNSILSTSAIQGTTLLWSNGATTSSITVTNSATYSVTRTDETTGCTSTATASSALKPIPFVPVVTVANNCGNSILSANTIAGTTLLWSNGATTSSITVTNQATYDVTRTDIASGCTSTASVSSDPKLVPATPVIAVTNNCGNSLLSTDAILGTSLLWSNGASTPSITVTNQSTYSVTRTDQSNNCSATASGISAPKPIPSVPVITVTNNCGNSVLSTTVIAGTSLLWNTGEITSSITVSNQAAYDVTRTDLTNGCTSTATGSSAPKSSPAAPIVSVVNNCGNSVLTASAFTGSLLWSNGSTTNSITVGTAGTYTVTQTVNGCTSTTGSGIAAPTGAGITVPTVTVVNNCGNSVLTASNYTGSLLWSTGEISSSITVTTAATYTVTQTVNGCTSATGSATAAPTTIPAAPGLSLSNNCGNSVLTASGFTGSLLWSTNETTSSITVTTGGNYSVSQTVNGCTSFASNATAAPKAIPSAPGVSVVDNCGSSVLTASGFTGSLLWNNASTTSSITVTTAATYNVTQTVDGCQSASGSGIAAPKTVPVAPNVAVVDNCGGSILTASNFTGSLLWSNNATTTSISVTISGTYGVSQTVNGCTSSTRNATASPKAIPAAPTVAVVNNCGNSVLTASNFTGSLLWSNGATTSSITVTTAGTYGVAQTINGCTSSTRSVTASPKAIPAAPTVTVVDNCGNSVLTASSYTGSLLWSNGATTSSITVSTAGIYTVSQTVNGCTSALGSSTAAPTGTAASVPTVTVVNNCGNSVLTASNFTGSLLWSTGATTSSITVTTAATYTVTQTVNGCTSAAGSGIAAPKIIPAAPTVTVVNNCGNSVLTASNYTGSLLWSNGATTTSITVTTAATYTVTQTINGCTSTSGSGIAAPTGTAVATPVVTVVNNCGNSVLTASNFTGSLLWSNGATTSSITVTSAATYTVTQTLNGCTSAAGSGVAAPKATPSSPSVAVTNNCGNSVLTASGFTGSLLWSNNATTNSITVTTAATYTVTQTVNGCTSAAGSGVAAPVATPATPSVAVTNNCGNSVLTASGFTGSLLWSNNATTTSITVTTAATYSVRQTVNGCTSATGSGTSAPKSSPTLSSSLTATAFSSKVFFYSPTSAMSGTTFTWSRAAVTGVSNAAANGTGNINETLVNTTTTSKTITYVYTLTANGCTSTQNVVVTLNAPATTNCVINASITSSFNSTSIAAGRYIWFNSAFNRGSLSGISGTVTIIVTNSKISFTANSVQYTLNVPSSRIRYDAAVSSASTQFINNIWETAVPRSYSGDVFMGGLAYLVPSNLPGSISNIVWTANVSIDKPGISLTWEWAAAVYSSFAGHSGLNIKPKDGSSQNPYNNNDQAGTPENFKSSLVSGARGTGGTNYTGTYTSSSTATCSTTVQQRPGQTQTETSPLVSRQLPAINIERLLPVTLEATVLPNPSNTYFNLLINGRSGAAVKVRVIDISGRVVEVHENVSSKAILRIGERLASGSYFVEVTQNNEQKKIKVLKFD
jgi:hypothetical protein